MASLDVRNLTRRTPPRVPFAKAVEAVLPTWDISLVFATDAKAKSLNQSLRRKNYIPNVLSYEVGKKSGEIVICLAEAKRQAASYLLPYEAFVLYLFIHGLLHLKGHPHGSTMDKMERALMARLAPDSTKRKNEASHRNWHRHRNPPDESRGGRRGARGQRRES